MGFMIFESLLPSTGICFEKSNTADSGAFQKVWIRGKIILVFRLGGTGYADFS